MWFDLTRPAGGFCRMWFDLTRPAGGFRRTWFDLTRPPGGFCRMWFDLTRPPGGFRRTWFDLTRPPGGFCRFYMDRNAIEAPKVGHDARQKSTCVCSQSAVGAANIARRHGVLSVSEIAVLASLPCRLAERAY